MLYCIHHAYTQQHIAQPHQEEEEEEGQDDYTDVTYECTRSHD
jgi:hypothetical protein